MFCALAVYTFHNPKKKKKREMGGRGLNGYSWDALCPGTQFPLAYFPLPNPAKAEAGTTSPSPASFSKPQTSGASNAPLLRNIRRSSRRNHRLPGRETALKERLSGRKIRGEAEGGGRRPAM